VNVVDILGLYGDFDSENNDAHSAAESQSDSQANENGTNGGYGRGGRGYANENNGHGDPINTGGYPDNDAVNASDPVSARRTAERQADQQAEENERQKENEQARIDREEKRKKANLLSVQEEQTWLEWLVPDIYELGTLRQQRARERLKAVMKEKLTGFRAFVDMPDPIVTPVQKFGEWYKK